jgi:hypothetical protein
LSAAVPAGTFVEKQGRLRDLGLGLEVVSVKSFAEGFRIEDGVCDFAMIKVWGDRGRRMIFHLTV